MDIDKSDTDRTPPQVEDEPWRFDEFEPLTDAELGMASPLSVTTYPTPGLAADSRWDDIAAAVLDADPELRRRLVAELEAVPVDEDFGSGRFGEDAQHGSALSDRARDDLHTAITSLARAVNYRHNHSDAQHLATAQLQSADLLAAAGKYSQARDTYAAAIGNLRSPDDATRIEQAARRIQVVTIAGIDAAVVDTDLDEILVDAMAVARRVVPITAQSVKLVEDFFVVDEHDRGELESLALDSPEAAELRLIERTEAKSPYLGRPLLWHPAASVVNDLLDANLNVRLVASRRGHQHRQHFDDLLIISAPDPTGDRQRDQEMILDTRLTSRPSLRVRDVIYRAGGFPEVSQVMIDELQPAPGEAIFRCPCLLRIRSSSPHTTSADLHEIPPHDLLDGLIVTSLGWGGAANVGSHLADMWGWGFVAASQAKLQQLEGIYPFGDWTIDPSEQHRDAEISAALLSISTSLVDAIQELTKRVCVLDNPQAAADALRYYSTLGDGAARTGIVLITMDDRRIRWAARHLLSQGGRTAVTADDIADQARKMATQQDELIHIVESLAPICPTVIVRAKDHLDDGYAESSTFLDPVDADFDCFYDTAQDVHQELLHQLHQPSTTSAASHV